MDSVASVSTFDVSHIAGVRSISGSNGINKNNYGIQRSTVRLWFAFDFTIHKPSRHNRTYWYICAHP